VAPLLYKLVAPVAPASSVNQQYTPVGTAVLWNMLSTLVAAVMSQCTDKSSSKTVASRNMASNPVAADVDQVERSPLKDDASLNIYEKVLTIDVSQLEISPLKAVACLNIDVICVTLLVSQFKS
jgi:hypothetical protein